MKNIRKYRKTIEVYNQEKFIGHFEELYFAPVMLRNIWLAIEIFSKKQRCPVILLHIDGIANESGILSVISEVIRYNKELCYFFDLCLEIRIRTMEDISILSSFLAKIVDCQIAVVFDSELIAFFDHTSIAYIEFLRINFKNINESSFDGQPFLDSNECYKLCRVTITNEIELENVATRIRNYGFNGMQIIKGHEKDISCLLSANIRMALHRLIHSDFGIDVYTEQDITHLNQPMFQIEDKDHGICFSSLLQIVVKNEMIFQCPYSCRDIFVPVYEIDRYLENRVLIDSKLKKCKDCGYISDNILYRNIYKDLV